MRSSCARDRRDGSCGRAREYAVGVSPFDGHVDLNNDADRDHDLDDRCRNHHYNLAKWTRTHQY